MPCNNNYIIINKRYAFSDELMRLNKKFIHKLKNNLSNRNYFEKKKFVLRNQYL